MKFATIGLLALLFGFGLFSNHAVTQDAGGNQPPAVTDAAKQIASLRGEIDELRSDINRLRSRIKTQEEECDCKTLNDLLRASKGETGKLRDDLTKLDSLVKDIVNQELRTLRIQLAEKAPTADLPFAVIRGMDSKYWPNFGIFRVKNLSGAERELIVDGLVYRIPADGEERELKILLRKDQKTIWTELRSYEPPKERILKPNKDGILAGEMKILLFQNP